MFPVCCHPEISLPWQRDVTTSPVIRGSTASGISRKVVGKSVRDNPERFCGLFCVHIFSKKSERTSTVYLRELKKSNKSRFDSYSFKKQCIDYYYIQYYLSGLSLVHFQDDLSRNGCTLLLTWIIVTIALQNIKANSCSDDNSHCVHWANGNECCKNPAYMLENCCSACKAKGKRVIFIIGSSFCKHYLDGGGGWLKSAKLEDSF